MELYSQDKNYKLFHGQMQDMETVVESNSIDSIVCDPPYELNFMGKGWDNAGVAFDKEAWKHCFNVLKPGGYLLAFGGSRTFHRIACAIEDAGFEIRDCIMWLYGSGFPKSYNIGKQIEAKVLFNDASGRSQKFLKGKKVKASMWTHHMSYEQGAEKKDYSILSTDKVIDVEYTTELGQIWKGWGTCLKPAFEPIIIARKPFKGSLVDNVIEYGVGGLNIDECRVETNGELIDNHKTKGTPFMRNAEDYEQLDGTKNDTGRFPANVILTYDDSDFEEVCGGFPNTKSTQSKGIKINARQVDNVFDNSNCGFKNEIYDENKIEGFNDEGSAARYFYCAKASKKDRDEGLDEFKESQVTDGNIRENSETARAFGANSVPRKNIHPTVKPTQLMQYLVRLVTPKGGTVMDCFMGSGTTGKAVMFENKERNANYKFIGIEMTDEYLPICEARIKWAKSQQQDYNLFNMGEINNE